MPYTNNQVQLIGNAGARPELHILTDETPVTRFRLYLNISGINKGRDSFQLVAWGRIAEHLTAQVRRGDRLLVQGQLRNRRFQYEGTTHLRTEIHISAFFILSQPREVAYTNPNSQANE
ncbi:MAG: single-stranded DNA-binding protein [Bacteroidota bacterium]